MSNDCLFGLCDIDIVCVFVCLCVCLRVCVAFSQLTLKNVDSCLVFETTGNP